MVSQYKPIIKAQYECDRCEELYDSRSCAEDCCAPEVNKVYVCPQCESLFFTEEAAIECCDFDPDAPPKPISALELERHGQVRLGGM